MGVNKLKEGVRVTMVNIHLHSATIKKTMTVYQENGSCCPSTYVVG